MIESGRRRRAYCLMPNHYQFLVETPSENLSAGMERLNGWYARWFNHKHETTGHLSERGFYSGVVEADEVLLAFFADEPAAARGAFGRFVADGA